MRSVFSVFAATISACCAFQLSLTLFSIIGGFWLLDSLKDTVLEGTVGLEYQPRAKLVSVAVTLLLVIQYNRLVDSCSKPTVRDASVDPDCWYMGRLLKALRVRH